jgi:hypothetical protein
MVPVVVEALAIIVMEPMAVIPVMEQVELEILILHHISVAMVVLRELLVEPEIMPEPDLEEEVVVDVEIVTEVQVEQDKLLSLILHVPPSPHLLHTPMYSATVPTPDKLL